MHPADENFAFAPFGETRWGSDVRESLALRTRGADRRAAALQVPAAGRGLIEVGAEVPTGLPHRVARAIAERPNRGPPHGMRCPSGSGSEAGSGGDEDDAGSVGECPNCHLAGLRGTLCAECEDAGMVFE